MKKRMIKNGMMVILLCMINAVNAQTTTVKKTSVVAWDGMAVAGYVNNGAFINFGGPSIKLIKKPLSIGIGFLPSIRIKEDKVAKDAKKNSMLMPLLGFGLTVSIKHMVIQLPVYYNAKTTTADGKWNPGIGIGYKF